MEITQVEPETWPSYRELCYLKLHHFWKFSRIHPKFPKSGRILMENVKISKNSKIIKICRGVILDNRIHHNLAKL